MSDAGGPRFLALFPGGLGDLLCCWPALAAWRRAHGAELVIAAQPPWRVVLPEDVQGFSVDRREVADLFGSGRLRPETVQLLEGFTRVASWTAHGNANFAARLAAASGAAVAVYPFRPTQSGEHAVDYYARCLQVTPDLSPLPIGDRAARWADALWQRHGLGAETLVIHPGSGSAAKTWQGMEELARTWRATGRHVVAVLGPAEQKGTAVPCHVAVRGESLDRVAALLARAPLFLGNDSGVSHLAGSIGGRGIALFGPSDPRTWRPRGGAIRVLAAPDPCRACGPAVFCTHRLPVDTVVAALDEGRAAAVVPEHAGATEVTDEHG